MVFVDVVDLHKFTTHKLLDLRLGMSRSYRVYVAKMHRDARVC